MGKKKPKNRTIEASGEWKQMELPGHIAVDSEFQYLACIEEMNPNGSDSDDKIAAPPTKEKKKTAKKRAAVADDNSEAADGKSADGVPTDVGKSKHKKRKSDSLPSHASVESGTNEGRSAVWPRIL